MIPSPHPETPCEYEMTAPSPAQIEHYLREDFEDLRRFVGFERARAIVADIINDAAEGKRNG